MSSAPPIVIIIGGHAYYFDTAAEAAQFAAHYAEYGVVPEQAA